MFLINIISRDRDIPITSSRFCQIALSIFEGESDNPFEGKIADIDFRILYFYKRIELETGTDIDII